MLDKRYTNDLCPLWTISTLSFQENGLNLDGRQEFNFAVNEDCMKSSQVNMTLKMKQPIRCELMEKFVLARRTTSCSAAIGYWYCKATNQHEVSASCDLLCSCNVNGGDHCRIEFLMRSSLGFQSVELSEIMIHG